ncbi:hypothetical protein B0H17DRAFT_1144345 [Mycena rosella]|uniref:Uncharacterized protein n=1 Tax=Mycena rosella TaxID=1033263 RepID=A0AAD7G3H6_MYCRO|nr:hypothetical protein B0H17DRAFT_1144345 [Mycena rosella]
MLDNAKLVKHFPTLLTALKKRIKSLPSSLPLGDADRYLSHYFGDLEVDAEEGAAFSANHQWEHVFQGSEEEKQSHIVRSPHGLNLVCPFLDFFVVQDGIKGTVNVGMLACRIHGLNSLLDSISKHTMSNAQSSMAASTASSTVVTKELLNAGFGEGLDYLEGITIN